MAAGERDKLIALQEIKDALSEQVGDDADVVSEIKGISKMNALIAVVLVVLSKGRENSQLDARCVSVLLYRADNLDSNLRMSFPIPCLDDLAESALAKQSYDRVWKT